MVREKIINWLKKLEQIKDYIETFEIAPAISILGIIDISFAKGKIKLNPEEWDDEDKENIANFLRTHIDITLKEFEELLKKEIREVSEEKQKSIREQLDQFSKLLTRLLVENPLIPLEEFERRAEIEPLLKYEFVGRESELEGLRKFLESDKKVFLLTGDGGVGKTRLAIEFAREVAKRKVSNGNWDVYFIDQDREFKYPVVSNVLGNRNTLLILDDTSRYRNRDRVIGFIQNPPEGRNIKLLLIDRPIFKGFIINEVKERGISVEELQIGGGNISSFIERNFEIRREDAERIQEESGGNFVIAIFLAEYYRDKGRIGKQKEAVDYRIEKYKKDIKEHTGIPIDDIENTLFLLSLLTPIEWKKDSKYIQEVLNHLPAYEFHYLKKVIGLAGRDFFILKSGEKYVFKYDLIAEYFLSQFMEREDFDEIVKEFLPYMPSRISYNILMTLRFFIPRYLIEKAEEIAQTLRFFGEEAEETVQTLRFFREEARKAVQNEKVKKAFQILGEIWEELNKIEGQTPEYFSALVLLTGNPFLDAPDIEKININHWIQCYEKVSKDYPEEIKEVRENLAKALVNAANHFGKAGKIEDMENCLEKLEELHKEYQEKELREELAKALLNATADYGRAERFNEMEACLEELRELHKKHPEKEVREKLAMGLYNAANNYVKVGKLEKMESYLKELRELHMKYEEKEIREELAKALFNATGYYGEAGKLEKMEACLGELRELHLRYPEKGVRVGLAIGLFNATNYYGRRNKLNKMEDCLKELRELHMEYKEREVREELAGGLFNAAHYYGVAGRLEEMEAFLKELRELHKEYPERVIREELAKALVNATSYYGKRDKLVEMEVCLRDLRALHIEHPEKEVREELAKGLFNAIYHYGRRGMIVKMEACLRALRELYLNHPEEEVRKELAKGLSYMRMYRRRLLQLGG
ncbi:MAG: Tetratricopeptide repeat [Methanophagales archaeon]|nr:hypothetical protein [Methanophagales archaeon]MCU4139522.1 Tetratricopeptide repeat [Methanophagales archaeon]